MDSANILSILGSLGQAPADPSQVSAAPPGPPVNVLQAAAPDASPTPQIDPMSAAIANSAIDAAPAMPQQRHSLVDIIGHIADGLASAGGATPMYQKTLDEMQARQTAAQDQAQKLATGNLTNATDQFKLGDLHNARLARAARGIQAIVAANPKADPASLWPLVAAQAGIPTDQVQTIAQQIPNNPDIFSGLATLDQDAGDAAKANQPGGGTATTVQTYNLLKTIDPVLAEKYASGVADPSVVVNTGNAENIVGKNSGVPRVIMPVSAKPDTLVNAQTSTDNNIRTNTTSRENNQATNATSRANNEANINAKTSKTGAVDPFTSYSNGVSGLRSLDQSLNDLITDPNLSGATGLVGGHLNITDGQRTIKGKIAALEGQAIPTAIATITASGGAAPRSVTEILGQVKGLVGAIQNRDMPTSQYIATVNAARARLRQSIQNMTQEAIRNGYAVQGPNGQIMPKAQAPAAGGWSVVGVK